MADNTIFDSAFRTIVQKMPELVIPLINEAFGRDYPDDEPFEQLRNEHMEPGGKIETDSIFKVRGFLYHIECQSTEDSTMAVRMVEYDFAIALEEAARSDGRYVVRFPESCVLYLRHAKGTPDALRVQVVMPSGQSVDYESRIVKAQRYSSDEIFAKRLLLLLPFYIMRYERELAGIAHDELRTSELLRECSELRERLEEATLGAGRAVLYDQIVEVMVRISDYLMSAEAALGKKVRAVMGGEVWELMTDKLQAAEERAERAERNYEQSKRDTLRSLVKKGLITPADAAAELGVSESEFAAIV